MPLFFLSITFPIMEVRFDAIVLVGMDFPYFLTVSSIFGNTFHIFAVFTECHIISVRSVTFFGQLDAFSSILLFKNKRVFVNLEYSCVFSSCLAIEDSA